MRNLKKTFPIEKLNEENSLIFLLKELKKYSFYYNKILNSKKETDLDIRIEIDRISLLQITVSYPFLIQIYDDYNNGIIDKKLFIEILKLIQSFVWRRFIVRLPTNALNKIFMSLYKKIDKDNYKESIERYLLGLKGSQRFPKDNEVIELLKIIDLYNIKPHNRDYLFSMLENHNNKEIVSIDNDKITVEHIFPQNPDKEWNEYLSKEEINKGRKIEYNR